MENVQLTTLVMIFALTIGMIFSLCYLTDLAEPMKAQSQQQMITYTDPLRRFTIDYPSGWKVIQSPEKVQGLWPLECSNSYLDL